MIKIELERLTVTEKRLRWVLLFVIGLIVLFGWGLEKLAMRVPPDDYFRAPVAEATEVYLPLIEADESSVFMPLVQVARPTETAPPARKVPFFWQGDPRWGGLRMGGTCTCDRMGTCGCALTSAAMVFKYWGVGVNPKGMVDCMGNHACPFNWVSAPGKCGDGLVYYAGSTRFSWEKLEKFVHETRFPVILRMSRGNATHFVVVLKGQGSKPENYTIHDPQYGWGANVKLSSRKGWSFDYIVKFKGKSADAPESMPHDPLGDRE